MSLVFKSNSIFVITLLMLIMYISPTLYAQNVSEDIKITCDEVGSNTLCADYNEGKSSSASDGPIQQIIKTTINLFAFFGGMIAVFYVIYGGFKYVTSSGNAEKASTGRQTIFYALIGLVLIVVAQQLVLFVISKL